MSYRPKNPNQPTRADIVNSDSDPYIAVGTPIFEDPEDDSEARREPTYGYRVKKNKEGEPPDQYLPTWKQVAADEEGRRRFHGAFTGGFSAGYYNTVGSKTGWTPSTFKSSRNKRASAQNRSITDYMDEEDMEAFGMNKNLQVKQKYETFKSQSPSYDQQKKSTQDYSNFGELFSGGFAPTAMETQHNKEKKVLGPSRPSSFEQQEIQNQQQRQQQQQSQVIPARESIGVRLLQRMGWKQGEGIGAKVQKKVYGVALPPGRENEDATTKREVYTAPKDAPLQDVVSKTNVYGLGYDPHQNAPEFKEYQLRSVGENDEDKSIKMGDVLRGGSSSVNKHGLGALEDEDDFDIYGSDDRSIYSSYLQDPSKPWSSKKQPSKLEASTTESSTFSSIRQSSHAKGRVPIPGFVLGERRTEPLHRWFAAPNVPRSFNPMHRFSKREEMLPTDSAIHKAGKEAIHSSAEERRKMLGEKALPGRKEAEAKRDRLMKEKENVMNESIYSFFKPEDRARIIQKAEESRRLIAEKRRKADEEYKAKEQQQKSNQQQYRYEETSMSNVPPKHDLFPHSSMSDRFVSSGTSSESNYSTASSTHEKNKSKTASDSVLQPGLYYPKSQPYEQRNQQKSEYSTFRKGSESKHQTQSKDYDYYSIETEEHEWHPTSLLCKRFEVPNPYPNSSTIGTVRKEKEQQSKPSSSVMLDHRQSQSIMPTASEMHRRSRDSTPSTYTRQNLNASESLYKDQQEKEIKKPQQTKEAKAMEELGLKEEEVFSDEDEEDDIENKETKYETSEEQNDKPSINLFKAIFENDEDEEDDGEDNVDEKEDSAIKNEGKTIETEKDQGKDNTKPSFTTPDNNHSVDASTSKPSSSTTASSYENKPLLNEDAFQAASDVSFPGMEYEDPVLREYQRKQKEDKEQKQMSREEKKKRKEEKRERKKKKKKKKLANPEDVEKLESRITQLKSLLSNVDSSDKDDLSSSSNSDSSLSEEEDKKHRRRKKKHRHKRKHKKDKKEHRNRRHKSSSKKSKRRKKRSRASSEENHQLNESTESPPPNKRRRSNGD